MPQLPDSAWPCFTLAEMALTIYLNSKPKNPGRNLAVEANTATQSLQNMNVTCRPLPTRPSHYVGGVLQSLMAFLGTDAGKRLQPSAQQEVAEVCRCICMLHCC